MVLSERASAVLRQVVNLHYNTCGPVGSKLISRTRVVPFSPATIRNIMMRLESCGYLSQPHTSAGRVPTDLGYRTYVNDISMELTPLDPVNRSALETALNEAPGGPSVLKVIADFIHERTALVTFHLPFLHCGIQLKHLHFERINPNRLLVLWVARGGQTFQSLLNIDEGHFHDGLIEKTENYFNHTFPGRNLTEIQRALTGMIGTSNDQWDLLLRQAALITNALRAEANQLDHLDFQGATRLLEMPEFQNIAKIKVVFDLLEQQTRIKNLVRHILHSENEWIMFFIGGEMQDPELENLSLVLAKISNRQDFLGCVGVLGPKRMPYLKSLQMLGFAKEKVASLPF